MSQTETIVDPRATAALRSVVKNGDEVTATLFMKNTPENIATLKDLGYELNEKEDIQYEMTIPEHEALGYANFGDFLVSSAQWVMGLKEEYPAKREFSRILIEFFQEITDEREGQTA